MALRARPRLNKSRGREVAKIDICRFDTSKLRAMTHKQLDRAQWSIGRGYEIPKRDKTRSLMSRFLFALQNVRRGPELLSERSVEAYRRTYGEDPISEQRIAKMWRETTDEYERKIWDEQAKAGCKIREDELVARDAEREGRPGAAARLRRKAHIR